MVAAAETAEEDRWGTWEELILGGAVLRHGPHHWNAVASELRSRTLYPFNFTPQVCKAKYEDLQRLYSGYTSWFEELKKRRVAELRKALQKSEDSIGSLELRLKALKAEKTYSNLGCSFNHAKSATLFQKFENDDCFGKEASKEDGLSAGSFTEETQPIESVQCQLEVKVLDDKVGTQPSASDGTLQGESSSPHMVNLSGTIHLECGFSIRKKRGERKRKGWVVKEACVGENNMTGSDNAEAKHQEQLANSYGPLFVENSSNSVDQAQCSSLDNLILVLNTVLKDEQASIFQRRMDGQKRARYRKVIRQPMDLDTIRWRITNKSITTVRELFRDLLLLANNALVFYSKMTKEYKCGLALQKVVIRKLRQHDEAEGNKLPTFVKSMVHGPISNKVEKGDSNATAGGGNHDSKASGKRGKVGRGKRGSIVDVQAKGSAKARKRPRIAD